MTQTSTRTPAPILAAFDRLAPGTALLLEESASPRAALEALQAERAGRFEWNVLETGPERHRVEVRARAAAGPRAVTEYLQTDHDRLDAIMTGVRRSVQAGAFADGLEQFGTFACGLRRHIAVEEQVLFPTFERTTGMRSGPTTVMRMEHVEIERMLGLIEAALRAQSSATEKRIDDLVEVLSSHNEKEEHILYPTTDRMLGNDRARDALVREMQSF